MDVIAREFVQKTQPGPNQPVSLCCSPDAWGNNGVALRPHIPSGGGYAIDTIPTRLPLDRKYHRETILAMHG